MKNMKKETIKYPRFLTNKLCEQDLFEGKSHDSISQNIANVLDKGSVKIVGLDGGWGSGKSNMVSLIKQKLNSNSSNKYHFYVYDAWGYQTDFQRRSILENLTSYLVDDAKIINHKKWNGRLLQLLSRKRSVGSKITKELSAISKVAAILAILLPIFVLLDSCIDSTIGKVIYWLIIFILSIYAVYHLQVRNMKKYGQPTNFANVIGELFFSYLDFTSEKGSNNIEASMKYETIYDEEPSSRDFRNWISDIDKDIDGHKLVIVFDNMDRLPQNSIQELWAAIHTFFAEQTYENIRVIVPFDRSHIKGAFSSMSATNNDKSNYFSDDYINKTFNVIYRVSPPVMSDWKAYFAMQWKEAFGLELEANSRVIQIYDHLSERQTPRDIISFINEFVSIKQITIDTIPDEYIALFIFGKNHIAKDSAEIISPNYLGGVEFLYKNDEDLPKFISALYYQLPPERALDIVYVDKIRKALDANDQGDLQQISKLAIFDKLLENALPNVTNIPNAVLALNTCIDANSSKHWDCIYKKLQTGESVLQEYQKILLRNISNKDKYLKHVINDLIKAKPFDVMSYYDSLLQLNDLEGLDPSKYYSEVEVEPQNFIDYVELAQKDYKRYKIVCDMNKLDEFLASKDETYFERLNVISILKKEYNGFESYESRLKELIDNNTSDEEKLVILYDRLKEIQRPVDKILSDADILTLFRNLDEDDEFYNDLICMRLSRLDKFQSSYSSYFTEVLNNTDDDIVDEIASNIENYMIYGDILLNASLCPLLCSVANSLTVKSRGTSRLNLLSILKNYDDITSSGIDSNALILRLSSWETNSITIDNISTIPYDFFEDSVSIDNKLTKHCKEKCIEYLKSLSAATWETEISKKSRNYKLLILLEPKIQNAHDAFKNLLDKKARGEADEFDETSYNTLRNLAQKHNRSLFSTYKNIRDLFCSGNATMSNSLFKLVGKDLLTYARLEEKQDALRTIFIPSILDDDTNVQLLIEHRELMTQIVANAGEDSGDFKEKVQLLIDGEYKEDEIFIAFAKAIGVLQ